MTRRVTTVVVGAGHAGLAASRLLTERSIEHVVLERGEVANSWRHERWDSLRLLTPNFQSRLPGHRYEGPDADGYMTMREVIEFISHYADLSRAPVRTHTTVTSLQRTDDGYHVATSDGDFRCRCVVIASGACNVPTVPALRAAVPAPIEHVTPFNYRNPAQLPEGGVLVVGPSATGVQLAAEIHRSGRPVTLSIGEHVRLPRTYRGRDVLWWMESSGVWDQRYDQIDDINRARSLPSPQLVGAPERSTLDLNALSTMGVELVGRFCAVRDGRALFSGGLRNLFALADLKMERLLDTFDEWARGTSSGTTSGRVDSNRVGSGRVGNDRVGNDRVGKDRVGSVRLQPDRGHPSDYGEPERFGPTRVPPSSRLQIDLRSGEIRSILWATGFRPDYGWLHIPVVDEKGYLRHDGGVVVDSPGMYVLGLPVLRRRKSSFIHGVEDDARELIDELARYLEKPGRAAATR